MENFDLSQTGQTVQNILDKAAQLPAKAALDAELFSKADKANTFSKAEVLQLIGAAENGTYQRVDTYDDLGDPTADKEGVIWLVGEEDAEEFDRYIVGTVDGELAWIPLGTTAIDLTGKADKVPGAVNGDFAGLDGSGNLLDSGYKPADFATAAQGEKADSAYQLPGSGIPMNDLATEVQNTLNRVNNKADKVSGATNNNLASLNSNGNLKDSGIATNMVALVLGRYMKMISGAAETLMNPNKVNASFLRRITGGALGSVGSGPAVIKRLGGVSRVWNQLAQPGIRGYQNCDTSIAGYLYTFTRVTASSNMTVQFNATMTTTGHKYLYILNVNAAQSIIMQVGLGTQTLIYRTITPTSMTEYADIINGDGNAFAISVYLQTDNTDGVITAYCPMLIDLTQLFNGSVPEGYTVADFKRDYPLLYYAYTTGKVLPFAGQILETTGPQQWDEAWEQGGIDIYSGKNYNADNRLRSSGYIPVFPNTEYSIAAPRNVNVLEYDANKGFLLYPGYYTGGGTFTTSPNTRYIRIYWGIAVGATYLHDISINISDPAINGQYFPYQGNTLAVNPDAWQDTDGNLVYPGGGMQGLGDVQDFAEADADGYFREATRVFGRVDMGTLNYYSAGDGIFFVEVQNLPSNYRFGTKVAIQAHYPIDITSIQFSQMSDKSFAPYISQQNRNIVIKDTSYATAAALKASLSGVYLYFCLATPVKKTLKTPIPAIYIEDKDGTEEWTPANTDEPYTSPCDMDIQYPFDAVGMLLGLAQKFISGASLDNALTAMCTALGTVSYDPTAKVWDESTKAWTYDAAFTAVEPTDNEE